MFKVAFFLLVVWELLLNPLSVFAQSSSAKPTLKITIPESDIRDYTAERIRLGGYTDPGNSVRVQGGEVTVYPTGAFVDYLTLQPGENRIVVESSGALGEASRSLRVYRIPPSGTTPADRLVIEDWRMLPQDSMDLLPGDELILQFKGTPGGEAEFAIRSAVRGRKMAESPAETQRGIYSAVWTIDTEQSVDKEPILFRLKALGKKIEKESKATLTVNPAAWPRVAEVIMPNGALAAGLGTARLGGAELGYVPQGTLLELTGRVGNMYRVKLTKTFSAWISQDSIKILSPGVIPPRCLPNRAVVSSVTGSDTLVMGLESRIPVLLEADIQANRLIANLYGATSNLTWITHQAPTTMIQRVSWQQVGDDHLQLIFDLKQPPVWGYDVEYPEGSNNLTVSIKHPPAISPPPDSPLRGIPIAIDAGHGGRNTGALGCLGTLEKDVNLAIARKLETLLESEGATVIFIRAGDEDISASERILTAIRSEARVFVSIHANSIPLSSDPAQSRGAGVFYRHEAFRTLAETLYENLIQSGLNGNGVVTSFNAAVVKRTNIPCVLVETAFLSHPQDEAILLAEDSQQAIAEALRKGLREYFERHGTAEIKAIEEISQP